jgi:hypothetical protein
MKTKGMKLKKAINVLQKKLKKDKDYRRGWVANIAMSYIDADAWHRTTTNKSYITREDKHKIANDAAKSFVKLLRIH